MGNQSQHSGSHHSSNTGPTSNNTGSTNLSNNHFLYRGQGGMQPPGGQYMSHVQMGPNGAQQTMLLGAYGGQGMYPPPSAVPQHIPGTAAMGPPSSSSQNSQSNCQTPASVASLQMV